MKHQIRLKRFIILVTFLFTLSLAQAQRHRDDRNHDQRSYSPKVERVVYQPVRKAYYPSTYSYYRYPDYTYNYYDYRPIYRYPYGSSIDIITSSIGVHIGMLPRGYRPVYWGSHVFFYFDGVFYRRGEKDFEVVKAPLGSEVPDLPKRAKVVVIDNSKFYEVDGTYYRVTIKQNGEIWYEVVGKEGIHPVASNNSQLPMGSTVSELPNGSKTIVLNNQKYFVAPDNTYYEEVIEDNKILYKVAGKPSL